DHILIVSQAHLRRVLKEYQTYFNCSRPHQAIDQGVPGVGESSKRLASGVGKIVALPIRGRLHHEYRRAA
ncbi:MAG TPA: hypothetical protein VEZ12_19605, partial [Herpetosiphonaceae bacterium]|nr:hypothetical protein [Herpetosiphonaceae bacterium]